MKPLHGTTSSDTAFFNGMYIATEAYSIPLIDEVEIDTDGVDEHLKEQMEIFGINSNKVVLHETAEDQWTTSPVVKDKLETKVTGTSS